MPTDTTAEVRGIQARDIPPTSPEEIERIMAIPDDEVDAAARADPDSPDPDRVPGPRYEPRPIRIREDLLEWFDAHPRRWRLVNELLDRYRAEQERTDAALADELEAIADRLRTRATLQRETA